MVVQPHQIPKELISFSSYFSAKSAFLVFRPRIILSRKSRNIFGETIPELFFVATKEFENIFRYELKYRGRKDLLQKEGEKAKIAFADFPPFKAHHLFSSGIGIS